MTYSYTDLLALFGIGGAHPGGLTLSRAILDELNLNNDTHFLEVGCGTGQTTAYIANLFACQQYAIEQHPVMLEKAKSRLSLLKKPVYLIEASTELLPFEDKKFDYILSESVTAFTNINRSLNEYCRVLKDKGKLVLVEMTELQPLSNQEYTDLINFYNFHDILSEEKWKQKLYDVGFTEAETFSISLEELIQDEDDFTEFNISPGVDPVLFEMLDQHDQLTGQYQNKLGFRVFFCKKG
jgi:ubiquinone/menaquinone biosynthesis C-methylase UbiE